MAEHFDNPPPLTGNEAAQLSSLYRYLYKISEQLNNAMGEITGGSENVVHLQRQSTGVGSKESQNDMTYVNQLKSMIIKTAEIVRTEMTEISTLLSERIEAISSTFGEYERTIDNRITASAQGIIQSYQYDERIQSAESKTADFRKHIEAYIFSGLIRSDSQGNPVFGIAIGDGDVTTYDSEGNAHLNNDKKLATFTKDRLSFFTGTTEVAYFSDRKLYITECEVTGGMKMGRFLWQVYPDESLGLIVS